MDKRFKKPDRDTTRVRIDDLYGAAKTGRLAIADGVKAMRRISGLTQPEFAKHRGISVQALKQIERGTGNPTMETLNKVASVFTLEVGFIVKSSHQDASRP